MKALRLKTYAMIALMVVLSSMGDLLLGLGMKEMGAIRNWSPASLGSVFLRIISSSTIWLGIACLLGFFLCYLAVLSWADFSYVKPSMAVSFGFVTFLAYTVLGERVTWIRWAGVALICVGVGLVGLTKLRTTEHAS